MKNQKYVYKMITSAICLSLAYVLPFATGQIPEIGSMLCPMHIPVLLCGFICGWQWGCLIGLIVPISRSFIFGAPQFFPMAVCMAFELATYGAVCGLFNKIFPQKKKYIYCSLLIAMIIGRLIWGISMTVAMGFSGGSFGLKAFIAGAITNALPGILAQIILVPLIVIAVTSSNIFKKLKDENEYIK